MQTFQTLKTIESEQKKHAILDIISDKYCRQILSTTIDKPKSIMDIYIECKIPISTIYRRIKMLQDNKLVSTTGMLTLEGKKYFLYKSKVKGIKSSCFGNDIKVQVLMNDNTGNDNHSLSVLN